MTQAEASHSTPVPGEALAAPKFNATLEPYGVIDEPGFPGMPEEIRDAIAVLRRARTEAANEIERLLGFLNDTEMDFEETEVDAMFRARFGDQPFEEEVDEREPEPEHDELIGDEEPSLGSSHGVHQGHWGEAGIGGDLEEEHDGSEPDVDAEPSLGWYDAYGQYAIGGGAGADDMEPSLGSTAQIDQRRWAAGESHDLEATRRGEG